MSLFKQSVIRTVVGDSPDIYINLKDNSTRDRPPVDLTIAGRQATLRIRKQGASTPAVAINCIALPGFIEDNGELNVSGEYAIPGRGGRVVASCPPQAFPDSGVYLAEAVVAFGSGKNVTVFETVRIEVRTPL